MIKAWHRSDIFDSLVQRGWQEASSPQLSPEQLGYVGEAYTFHRSNERIDVYFVADLGIGFVGPESIEAVVAKTSNFHAGAITELWLHRTRNSKWRMSLMFWSNRVSGIETPNSREPNLPVVL